MYHVQKISEYKKKIYIGILFFLFLILMLIFPKITLNGATNGLLLWFNTLLPVFLPFIMISGILIRLNIVSLLSSVIYPILKPFFPISLNGAYPVFIGFLSGLPVGAKVSAELAAHGKISKNEGIYIASMCNNVSPAFLINYAAATHLLDASKGIPLCIVVYISSIIASRLIYFFYINKKNKPALFTDTIHINKQINTGSKTNTQTPAILNAIDDSIITGFETVTRIGGYVIIFSILSEFLTLVQLPAPVMAVLSSTLEITTGIKNLGMLSISEDLKFILMSMFAAFGGLSALAQTQSVLSPSGLPIKPYILSKITCCLLAAILSLIYILIL